MAFPKDLMLSRVDSAPFVRAIARRSAAR